MLNCHYSLPTWFSLLSASVKNVCTFFITLFPSLSLFFWGGGVIMIHFFHQTMIHIVFISFSVRADFVDSGEFVVWWLVCRMARRQIEACFCPWYNHATIVILSASCSSGFLWNIQWRVSWTAFYLRCGRTLLLLGPDVTLAIALWLNGLKAPTN